MQVYFPPDIEKYIHDQMDNSKGFNLSQLCQDAIRKHMKGNISYLQAQIDRIDKEKENYVEQLKKVKEKRNIILGDANKVWKQMKEAYEKAKKNDPNWKSIDGPYFLIRSWKSALKGLNMTADDAAELLERNGDIE